MPVYDKVPKRVLEYRERVGRGRIMRPETFERITREAERRDALDPEAVAGAAYWRTAKAKYREARQRRGSGIISTSALKQGYIKIG